MSHAHTSLDRSAAALGLATVVAANGLYLAGLPLILDPMLSTEPLYIQMAQRPLASILSVEPAWGPLYALWLKPLVAVLGDPVAVYTANVYALSVGVSVLIYLYLLLLTRRAVLATGAALFFLISDFNVPLPNKVSGFALMVVLAGLTAAALLPAGARRMTAVAVGVLLASYARPELYPAALCLFLAALWLVRREAAASGWGRLWWPAIGLAATLMLALSIGTPLFSPRHSGDRLLMAFREHFAWNWSRWHNEWRYVFSIWEQEFGGAHTTLQAVVNNPRAVAHHVVDNLFGVVRFMVATAFDHYPVLFPATVPAAVKAESLAVSAAVLGSVILVAARPGWRRQLLDRYGHALFAYAVLATGPVAAAIVIFPMAGYLVIPGVLLMVAGALAATLVMPAVPACSRSARALAALACLAAVPRPFVLPSSYVVPGAPFKGRITVARTVMDTIGFLRALNLSAPVRVLALPDGIGEMLGSGFQEVKIWQKGVQPLDTYVRDSDVGVIINLEGGRTASSSTIRFGNSCRSIRRRQGSPA